jgi:hypothetical protein
MDTFSGILDQRFQRNGTPVDGYSDECECGYSSHPEDYRDSYIRRSIEAKHRRCQEVYFRGLWLPKRFPKEHIFGDGMTLQYEMSSNFKGWVWQEDMDRAPREDQTDQFDVNAILTAS